MNFLKTFLITLFTYLGLNTLFTLIFVFTTTGFPTNDALYITALIFAPITVFPTEAWASGIASLILPTDIVTTILTFLGVIVPPIVALILAAKLGDERDTGFNAWLITALVSAAAYAFLIGLGQLYSAYLYLEWFDLTTLYGGLYAGAIIAIFIGGLGNGFFYGCLALLVARKFL